MLDLRMTKTTKKPQKKKVSTNVPYTATVKEVRWTPGYVKGKAFDICYDLVDDKGNVIEYKEMFYEDQGNERTAAFYEHLNEIGIEDIADYVGCKEKLIFLKDVKNNRTYVNIDSRTLISRPQLQQVPNVGNP